MTWNSHASKQLIVYFSADAACRDDRDAFNHLAHISCRYAVIATGSTDKQTLRSFKNPVLVFDAAFTLPAFDKHQRLVEQFKFDL